MKVCFAVTARDKGQYAYRCASAALAQTYPCEIILSDQLSTDNTYEEMARAVSEAPRGAEHTVRLLRCPLDAPYTMVGMNRHFDWIVEQTDAEWIFQTSADDWSLPDRVRVCMQAIESHSCATVATTVKFHDPEKPDQQAQTSIFESGYISAGAGLRALVYGSCIAGYKREFLKKVGSAGPSTMDVFYGYLAALDSGFYVVANPQHVHFMAIDEKNTGFQGKMRAAEKKGEPEITRVNELNRFQLFELYYNCARRGQEIYPLAHQDDKNAVLQMMVDQACGWYTERKRLHDNGWTPGVI